MCIHMIFQQEELDNMVEENIGSIEPDFSLKGKLAIITGASMGIGKEIARAFAAAGAEIIVTARTESKLIELKEEVEKDGGKCHFLVNDITNINQIQDLADFIREKLSEEEKDLVLVNNAGFGFTKPVLEVTQEDFDLITSTHLRGTFFCCQKIGEIMLERGYGKIINLGSTWGYTTDAKKAPYCMAKAGIAHMSRAISTEWAPNGIRINTLAPTGTVTEFTQKTWESMPERAKGILSRIKLGRFAYPSDHLGAAIFLASSASDFITGQTIYVDGGFTAAG